MVHGPGLTNRRLVVVASLVMVVFLYSVRVRGGGGRMSAASDCVRATFTETVLPVMHLLVHYGGTP